MLKQLTNKTMKKLLFKTLFYTIIFTIRVSKKLGYYIRSSLHDVPLELIPHGGELKVGEAYRCIEFEGGCFMVFIKR